MVLLIVRPNGATAAGERVRLSPIPRPYRPRRYELERTDNASIGEALSAFVSDEALEWA